jgi:hypothetical protein
MYGIYQSGAQICEFSITLKPIILVLAAAIAYNTYYMLPY